METWSIVVEDEFIESDDLGLGYGLKPGGLPPLPPSPPRTPNITSADDQNTTKIFKSEPNSPLKSPEESKDTFINQDDAVKDIISRLSSWKLSSFLEKFSSLSLKGEEKQCPQAGAHTGGNNISSCKKCKKHSTKKARRRTNSDSALDDNRIDTRESPLRRTKSVRGTIKHLF